MRRRDQMKIWWGELSRQDRLELVLVVLIGLMGLGGMIGVAYHIANG